MFCDRCGATVPSEQRYCGRCGKELFGPIPPVYQSASRVQQHIRLLGILWVAMAALNAIGGVAVYIVANTIFVAGGPAGHAPVFLHPLLTAVAGLILVKAALGFAAGWGLFQREPWARMLTIVLSFLSLFNVPLGTALGIYGLWVLLPAESEREYHKAVQETATA
jgi:hypothetical protein